MRMFSKIAGLAAVVAVLSVWAVAEGTTAGALTIPLKGLTKDNAMQVETALTKLDRNGFRCATCEYFSTKAGDCPSCGTALVADKAGPLLRNVKLDIAKGSAMFGIASASGARLSEIETALTPTGAKIDQEKLEILPFTRLTITGITSEEDGKAIEKTLHDAKLFDAIKSQVNTEHGMAIVIVGSTKTAPTYEALSAAIGKAGDFKLAEVAWTAACPKCAEKGLTHAGCMACWEKHP